MKREQIQKALLANGYSYDSMKSLMCGRAKPSMKRAIELNKNFKVPFEVWIDIKSYLQDNNTSNK